jgi:hypothetical protein
MDTAGSTAATATRDKLILLVESNRDDRGRLGEWLETAGYSLLDCPGPQREDFSCLGVRGKRCALVEIADMAILDEGVLLEAGADRRAAARLLHYYLASGKPVVVLTSGRHADVMFENDRVARVNRCKREAVLMTIRDLLNDDRRNAPE